MLDALWLLCYVCMVYNAVREAEYIPYCFRVRVQFPLYMYMGKDADQLDPNRYRGITLLSTFNKVYEVLVWRNLEAWWKEAEVIPGLQYTCKRGVSCLNTALLLRQSIATSMEDNSTCYVALFDVEKAIDTVWVGGMFCQLWYSGMTGKTWRLLYRNYLSFPCCARVQGHVCGWYSLKCGMLLAGHVWDWYLFKTALTLLLVMLCSAGALLPLLHYMVLSLRTNLSNSRIFKIMLARSRNTCAFFGLG